MTMRNSWPGPTNVTSTTDARIDLSGMLEGNTAGVARAGVFPTSLAAIVAARSDMNVNVAAFQGVAVQFGGPVLLANDGTMQLPSVLVSPASGTNYYVVYAKQNEQTAPGTDANNLPVLGAALSTTSFAAARGTLPTGALELATVQVPAGVAATNAGGVTITQTAQYTAAEGGVVPVRNNSELTAWTPADGSLAFQIDTLQLWLRQGGAWLLSSGAASIGAYTATGIYSTGANTPQATRVGNRVSLEGIVVSTSATFATGTVYTVGSVPAAFAPSSTRTFPVYCGIGGTNVIAYLNVTAAGSLQLVFITGGATGTLSLYLDGVNWRM